MNAISSLRDEEVDELLAGHVPDGRRELTPLAEVAAAVRRRTAEEPAPVMRYPLRHAVTHRVASLDARRPHRVLQAALGGAAIAAFGLAGAANALPTPVQDAVADVSDVVGGSVPHADEDRVEVAGGGEGPTPNQAATADDEVIQAKVARPPDATPGGAIPADPGTPGDLEPATPAIPPEPDGIGHGPGAIPTGEDAHGDPLDDPALGNGNADDSADNADDAADNADGAGDDGGDHGQPDVPEPRGALKAP